MEIGNRPGGLAIGLGEDDWRLVPTTRDLDFMDVAGGQVVIDRGSKERIGFLHHVPFFFLAADFEGDAEDEDEGDAQGEGECESVAADEPTYEVHPGGMAGAWVVKRSDDPVLMVASFYPHHDNVDAEEQARQLAHVLNLNRP